MSGHHFLSYPSVKVEFASRLHDLLLIGEPSIQVWMDTHRLRSGKPGWRGDITEAIQDCESFIFVITEDSVKDQSVCMGELDYALKCKKPVIPVLLDPNTHAPVDLGHRQHIDFTRGFDVGMALLREQFRWMASPAGRLQALKDRLEDAQRDLRRANNPEQQARIQTDIDSLQDQIAHQQYVVDNPEEAERGVEERIERELEREREPEKTTSGTTRTKFINPPPGMAPAYWQDRDVETKLVGDFLQNDALRLISIVGRGGIGKTVMVCRLLKSLESGRLPDDGGTLNVDGIVYLSKESGRINVPNLYTDLCRLVPKNVAEELEKIYKDPQASTEAKMRPLLEALQSGRYVLLLDSLEHVMDLETRKIGDAELDEALRALLDLPHHAVKVILTTRFAGRDLALLQPQRQARLDLDDGLPSPYAQSILREMDMDGKVGLKTAPDELLDKARLRTRGYPRALEALFAILSTDRDTSLHEILDGTKGLLPENVVEVMVGEAFSRLDSAAQMVMQALAIYSRPVTPTAVDYLLQPHLSGVDSAPVLSRLVNMQFVRKEAGRYYLHEVDRAYALSRVPGGEVADREASEAPAFTQFALLHRAANYFEEVRTPRETWRTIEDLAPQLAEFDLRYAGRDYEKAASVLLEIDFDYLFLWGHSRLVIELHESLQGKLNDPQLQQNSVGNLGSAYYMMGRYQSAITYYEKALNIAREKRDRLGEAKSIGNLGNCYSDLGQTERAIEHHEQALDIAREIGARSNEARYLHNLGNCYANLGQTVRAKECYEQSLDIGREIGYRALECFDLAYLGRLLVRQGELDKVARQYEAAIQIADEIGYSQVQNEARYGLALAYLHAGNLTAGRAAAEAARHYDVPQNNANVGALLGVISLGQGDRVAAQGALEAAAAQAEALLGHSERNYGALDSKGLALCGLALCKENSDCIPAAEDAYRSARAINKDVGIVEDVLRLFDALAQADSEGMVAEVRAAAAGQ